MSLGLSATSAAILGGSAVLSAGIGAAGASGMFGGGGGGSTSGNTKAQMDQYIKDTQADANLMVKQVGKIAKDMQTQIADLGSSYANAATDQEKQAIERINRANEVLARQAGSISDSFSSDINQAISDLAFGTEVLNLGSRADTMAQLDQFKTEVGQIDATLRADSSAALNKFDEGTGKSIQEYQSGTKSLGDLFLEQTAAAQNEYRATMDTAASLDPARLNQFSQAADQLSRSAVQTRMNLLDMADPRGRELSAIADENAAALMSGRISSEVQANLARSGAMRALQGGFGGDSQMGRNLQARDLGLTSLDLVGRGTQMYDNQRRLNFDTRVAGTQVDATTLLRDNQDILAKRASTLLGAGIQTAESNRDQRMGVFGDVFRTRNAAAAGRLEQETGIAQNIYTSNLQSSGRRLDLNVGNLNDIYSNRYDTVGTMFNARTGTAEQLFKTGIGLSSDTYGTAVGASSDFYRTNVNVSGNIFDRRSTAAANASQLRAQAQRDKLDALTRARGAAAGTNAAAAQQDMLNSQATTASNNAMWGSVINTGASLAGNIFGNMNFSGGFGKTKPYEGFGNFDYGSGTGA